MKKLVSIILCISMLLCMAPVMGSAQGAQVLNGDYVVIVNTNPNQNVTQSTGAIVFNSSGDGSTVGSVASPEGTSLSEVTPAITGTAQTASKTYSVGSTVTARNMNYTCVAVGTNCYVWMETALKADYDALGKTTAAAEEMKNIYEGKPYSVLSTIANGRIPYLDGSDKLSILMENDPSTTAAGYYGMETNITAIHINCPAASSYMSGSLDGRNGLLAHEGQHAVFQLLASEGYSTNGYRWIDEGLAITAMEWTWGKQPTSQWLSYIEGSSQIRQGSSLVYENYRSNTALDYSLPALYVRYLANRYAGKYAPLLFMQELYKVKLYKNSNADNQKTVEEYMNDLFIATGLENTNGTALTFRQSLVDFYVACVKQDRSGIYGFSGDTTVYNSVKNYPVYMGSSGAPVQLEGTAAIVVKTVDGTFTVPESHGADIEFIAVNKAIEPFRPAVGNGTKESPFMLSTAQELSSALDQYPNAYFELSADIDLSKTVCSAVDTFNGVLDGRGHTISGLNRSLIFENNGTVKNLNLVATGNDEYLGTAAMLVEYNYGIVQDCTISGSMTPRVIGAGIRYTPVWGTLVSINTTLGTVERCASTADVTLTVDANVSHDTVAGNLVGQNSGIVRDCYTAGSLNVTRVGNSAASYYVGGIAGSAKGGMSNPFYRCYSVTNVVNGGSGGSTDAQIGRFVGGFGGYVYLENVYSLSGMAAVGNSTNVSVKTETELKTQSTYNGWNFSSVWKLNSGSYPTFFTESDITSVEAVGTATIFVGQTLDYLSLMYIQLRVNGDNDNLVDMSVDMADLSTLDSSTVGTKTVSCEYRGKAFPLTVQVNAPSAVSDLAVYVPGRTSYVVDSEYDVSGVVLSAKLNGATYNSYINSGFTYDKTSALTTGDTSVTYTYCGHNVSQAITVSELGINGIEIVSEPDKSIYASGEMPALTNLGAKLSYNDGTVTPTYELADLQQLGVKLAKRSTNGIWSTFDTATAISVEDNDAVIYLYAGDVLPSDTNSVVRGEVVTLSVQQRMSLDDQIVVLKLGKAYDYAETAPITGTGYISVTKVSGTLPSGVSVYTPWEAGEYFGFAVNSESGITGSIKDYPLTYKIENESTGQILYVNITIRVLPKSSIASFEYVKFKASQNAGKLTEDVNGVVDSTSGTVSLTVPYGTPKKLTLEYMAAEGGSVYHPNGEVFFNGSYDFSVTNPVPCKVVAEDGTEKSFTIELIEAPLPVQELISDITKSTASWTNDDVMVSFNVSSTSAISGVTVNGNTITGNNGSYSFTASANGEYVISAADTAGNTDTETVTITNIDKSAPSLSVTAAGMTSSDLSESISFDKYFNGSQSITLASGDADSGVASAYYYIASSAQNVNAISDWTVYNGSFSVSDNGSYVVYAKCIDNAGNISYVSSDGFVINNTVPSISGIADGGTYCLSASFTVSGDGIASVTDNGNTMTAPYTVSVSGTHNIVATNIYGSSTQAVITVNAAHTEGTMATCHTKAVCSVCSQTYGEFNANNHDGETVVRYAVAATCKTAGYTGDTYCLGCTNIISSGLVIPATGLHTWEVSFVTPATCHTYSVTNYVCSVCDETKSETGTAYDASNHDGGTEIVGAVEPTCGQNGHTGAIRCLGCTNNISTDSVIPATGLHTWGVSFVVPATCHTYSETNYVCSVCDETKSETGTVYDASNHDGETEVRGAVAATCKTAGYTGDTYCLGCENVKATGTEIPVLNTHTWVQTSATPATCHTYSVTNYVCSVCDETKSETGTVYDASNHDGETEVRYTVAATCKTAGYTGDTYCLGCGNVKATGTEIPVLNTHTWVQTSATPATCHTGEITHFECTVCNETKSETGTTLDASNHDGETEVRGAVAATCKTAGYTGNTYCLGCGNIKAAGSEIPMLNTHTWVQVSVTPATCHTYSVTNYVCSVCDETKSEIGTVYDASNHDGETEVRYTVAATCKTAGYTGDTYCLGCGNIKVEGTEIPVLNTHTWVQTSETPATCHTCSETNYVCSVCDETKSETGTTLDASNHVGETEVRDAVAATCKTTGYTGDTYCLGCENVKATGTEIPVLNTHTWVHTSATPATCHTYSVTNYVCSVCDETKSETGTVYDTSNHDGETEVRNAVAATCKTAGYTGDTYCLSCGNVKATGTEMPLTNEHIWVLTSVTPATCHTGEITHFECTVCNETKSETGTTLDASNHDGETEVRGAVAATCCADGYTGDTYCLGCNNEIAKGEKTDATGLHSYGAWQTVLKQTCVDEGIERAYCSTSGCTEYIQRAIAADGKHNGTAATCSHRSVCSVCSCEFGELNPNNHVRTHIEGAYDATYETQGYTGDTVCDECGTVVSHGSVIPVLVKPGSCGCCDKHNHSDSFFDKIACFFCKLWQSFLNVFK